MKIDEEKRREALEFLNRWAHDSGAEAISFLEGKVSAVIRFPTRRLLVSAVPCACAKPGCEGWTVKNEGAFDIVE